MSNTRDAFEFEATLDSYKTILSQQPHNAEVLFKRGELYIKNKKYTEAIADFTEAEKYYQNFSEKTKCYDEIAKIYRALGNHKAAAENFKGAHEFDVSGNAAYFCHQAAIEYLALYDEEKDEAKRKKIKEEVISSLTLARRKASKNQVYQYAVELGCAYLKFNDLENARWCFEYIQREYDYNTRTVESNKMLALSYIGLGKVYYNTQDAVEKFERALRYIPLSNIELMAECYFHIAVCSNNSDSERACLTAIEYLTQASQLPDKKDFYRADIAYCNYKLGCAYQNNPFLAIQHFEKALPFLIKDKGDCHLRLAKLNSNQQKHSEAIKHYDAAISLLLLENSSSLADCYFNKGKCLNALQQYDAAIKSFEEALKKSSDCFLTMGAYYEMGISYALLGKHLEAIVQYTKAINEPHPSHASWNHLACCYQKRAESCAELRGNETNQTSINDYKQAVAILSNKMFKNYSESLIKDIIELHLKIGDLYQTLQDDKNAAQSFKSAAFQMCRFPSLFSLFKEKQIISLKECESEFYGQLLQKFPKETAHFQNAGVEKNNETKKEALVSVVAKTPLSPDPVNTCTHFLKPKSKHSWLKTMFSKLHDASYQDLKSAEPSVSKSFSA